jgi:hypothetical protein
MVYYIAGMLALRQELFYAGRYADFPEFSSNLDLICQAGVHFATSRNAGTKFARNIHSARRQQ